jgi:hypothetical protein
MYGLLGVRVSSNPPSTYMIGLVSHLEVGLALFQLCTRPIRLPRGGVPRSIMKPTKKIGSGGLGTRGSQL